MALSIRRSAGLCLLLVAGAVLGWAWHRRHRTVRPPSPAVSRVAVPIVPATVQTEAQIPLRSNFVAACAPFHLDPALLPVLIRAARPVFNLGHVQAGHRLVLVRTSSGAPRALSYQIDPSHTLWLRAPAPSVDTPASPPAPTQRSPGMGPWGPHPEASRSGTRGTAAPVGWTASIETTPYEIRLVGVSGVVQSSLFGAVEGAGEGDQLALDLADIFGWDLDFYTDPRPGDVFRVLVEKKFLNGKFSGYGQVLAAEYVNAGEVYDALRFHDDLGLLAYYRPDGRPMKRAFLRSPLKFAARISSGFSTHRFHPILKIYRPHLGVDFAAPIGTPVQTIGAGVVTRAGRFGGDGNMVQIKHSGGYQTLYLHLSRILVRVGQRVAQGERIGLVGMTGLATGPHLDFRIEHNGAFENFEQLRKKLPPADPVSAKLLPQFRQLCARYLPELAKLQPAAADPAGTTP